MSIIKDSITRYHLMKHLDEKPSEKSVNDRLLAFMKHHGLLTESILNVVVEEYRNSLPISDSEYEIPFVPEYHHHILLNALDYCAKTGNRKASRSLAEVLSDSGSATDVARIARKYDDFKIASVAEDMSKLRWDIVKETARLLKQQLGRIPYKTESALNHYQTDHLTVRAILR
ncbi:MAG: hypothetical protein Q7J54_06530 [Candidatus Woesearchaeota archaeon]|nr:hypothetical protein [Candidatus Woesearchaeota archaeon]